MSLFAAYKAGQLETPYFKNCSGMSIHSSMSCCPKPSEKVVLSRLTRSRMVALDQVQASNAKIATTYPDGLVAVFAGATAGIGETSLREFARHASRPRIYVIGRSREACDRLDADLKNVNPDGVYIFIRSDVSLLRNVDEVCKDIRNEETAINVLFMSQGTLNLTKGKPAAPPFFFSYRCSTRIYPSTRPMTRRGPRSRNSSSVAEEQATGTDEGLSYMLGLTYFGRMRMAANLLPLLQRAKGLRRVVSSFAGAHDGKVYEEDWQGKEGRVPALAARGHSAAMMTLGLAALARRAPEVSFVHNFPGSVRTNLIRGDEGFVMQIIKYAFKVALLFVAVPLREVGERHAFYCTSAKYPAQQGAGMEGGVGVPLPAGASAAEGLEGKMGSGVYTIDAQGESAGADVHDLHARCRTDGTAGRLWGYTESEFKRVTGAVSI